MKIMRQWLNQAILRQPSKPCTWSCDFNYCLAKENNDNYITTSIYISQPYTAPHPNSQWKTKVQSTKRIQNSRHNIDNLLATTWHDSMATRNFRWVYTIKFMWIGSSAWNSALKVLSTSIPVIVCGTWHSNPWKLNHKTLVNRLFQFITKHPPPHWREDHETTPSGINYLTVGPRESN